MNQNPMPATRRHIAAFTSSGGLPKKVLDDRAKAAVIWENEVRTAPYNASVGTLLNHCVAVARACRPYRAKAKGKVERPLRSIRRDFFLARTLPGFDDLNARFDGWRKGTSNPRVHATTRRVVDKVFAEDRPSLTISPTIS